MGRARAHIEFEVVGPGPLHVDQGPAGRLQAEGVLVHGPLTGQFEALAAALVVLRRVDRAGQGEVAARILQGDVAIIDDEALDRRQLDGLGRLRRIEAPVGLVVLVADQVDLRLDDAEQGQVELADEQRQQPGAHVDLADIGEIARAGPFRIADPEAADLGARRPRQRMDSQMALDAHLPAGAGRGVARNRPAQPVPVEQHEEQHSRQKHGRDDRSSDHRASVTAGPRGFRLRRFPGPGGGPRVHSKQAHIRTYAFRNEGLTVSATIEIRVKAQATVAGAPSRPLGVAPCPSELKPEISRPRNCCSNLSSTSGRPSAFTRA